MNIKIRQSVFYIMTALLLFTNLHAQGNGKPHSWSYNYKQGHRFIKKAEKCVNSGKLKRAERLLDKAEDADYGFCGNAWSVAYGTIHQLRAKIDIERKNYDEALARLDTLDGCYFEVSCSKREVLKVEALIGKFGKEKVRTAFQNASCHIATEDYKYEYVADLHAVNYSFRFNNYWPNNNDSATKPETPEEIKALMQKQEFYTLID